MEKNNVKRIGFVIGKITNIILGIGLIVFGAITLINGNLWGIVSCLGGIVAFVNVAVTYGRCNKEKH